MKLLFLCLWGLLLLPGILPAQKIDNTSSFRNIISDTYSRVHYDNDKFSGSDRDYTMGYSIEVVAPFFSKNPANYLLITPAKSDIKYGIATENIGFSPQNIKSTEIQNGDRPFAAVFMLKSFTISTNSLHRSRLTSSLNLGIIGPGAFGKEVQVYVHKSTGKTIPDGWCNQIKNDPVLNYEVSYEKEILQWQEVLSVNTNSNIQIGTLFTNASVGISSEIGIIGSPFTSQKNRKRFLLYSYCQVTGSTIGYDATLQGGVFNSNNSYTIASDKIERFTGQINYGLVFQAKFIYFEYFQSILTKEYAYGNPTKWGGIKVGVQL